MPKPIRAFIAVKIPSTPMLRKVLSRLETTGRAVKPVSADKLHVTLKFLGDTDPELIPEIGRNLIEAAAGEAAFDVRIHGLGAFPRIQRPSVLWAGLENAEPMIRIAGHLEKKLQKPGFPREQRKFQPHLTLARIRSKPPEELTKLFHEYQKTEFGDVTIDAVKLFQSELSSDGPRYTVLASVELSDETVES